MYVSLKIYDAQGNEITELAGKVFPDGEHKANFSSKNLAAGTYFYTLQNGKYLISKKMVILPD